MGINRQVLKRHNINNKLTPYFAGIAMQTLKSIIQDKPKNSRLYTLESMKIIKPDEWYAHVRLTKNPSNLPNEVREAYRELATKYSEKDLPTVYEVRNIAGKLTTKDESIDTLFKIINP